MFDQKLPVIRCFGAFFARAPSAHIYRVTVYKGILWTSPVYG